MIEYDYPSKKLVLESKKQFQKDVKDFIINDDTDLNKPPVVPVGHIDENKILFEEDEEWRSHLVKCILVRVKSYDAVGGIWKALNEYVQRPETVGIWWRVIQSVIHYIHTYINFILSLIKFQKQLRARATYNVFPLKTTA